MSKYIVESTQAEWIVYRAEIEAGDCDSALDIARDGFFVVGDDEIDVEWEKVSNLGNLSNMDVSYEVCN